MNNVRFDPGHLVLVSGSTATVLIEEAAGQTTVQRVIELATGAQSDELLQFLRATGPAGNFAAVVRTNDGVLRVAVSGSVEAVLEDAAGTAALKANAGSVFELNFTRLAVAYLHPTGVAPMLGAEGTDLLGGAVRAGRVVITLPTDAAAAPPQAPDAAPHAADLVTVPWPPAQPPPIEPPAPAAPPAPAPPAVPAVPPAPAPPAVPAAPPAPAPPAVPAAPPAPPAPPVFGSQPGQSLIDLGAPVAPREPLPALPVEPLPVAPAPVTPPPAEPAPVVIGVPPVIVQGVRCPVDHHNHPDALYCASCGRRMGVNRTLVLTNGPRPPVGLFIADDGLSFSLAANVIIGREPETHPEVVANQALPWRLPDPSLELSRAHVAIRIEGWDVYAIDLGSSNGTMLLRRNSPTTEPLSTTTLTRLGAGDGLRLGRRDLRLELHHVAT